MTPKWNLIFKNIIIFHPQFWKLNVSMQLKFESGKIMFKILFEFVVPPV